MNRSDIQRNERVVSAHNRRLNKETVLEQVILTAFLKLFDFIKPVKNTKYYYTVSYYKTVF